MKPTCSVNFLLERNASYSGWLKKITNGLFGNSIKRKYAVIHEGLFYMFDDDESLSTSDVLPLNNYTFNILERTSSDSKWSFSLTNNETKVTATFTVGSEREHKEWIKVIQDWKIISNNSETQENDYTLSPEMSRIIISKDSVKSSSDVRERMPLPSEMDKSPANYEINVIEKNMNHNPLPLPPKPPKPQKEMTSESEDYYANPDECTEHDFVGSYLPVTVYQWKLDRNGAKKLLDECGTPGVYLLRKGKDKGDVISAYLLGDTRHYKIFIEGEEMYLKSDHPCFRKLVDLIMYYHLNNLPTCHARLETPYTPELTK